MVRGCCDSAGKIKERQITVRGYQKTTKVAEVVEKSCVVLWDIREVEQDICVKKGLMVIQKNR